MQYIRCMRATLDIDDDVFAAAEMLAAGKDTTIGKVISDLARQALDRPLVISDLPLRNGIRVLPRRGGGPVTNEMVQELLEPRFCPKTGLWGI
jgi:hypothetical protein